MKWDQRWGENTIKGRRLEFLSPKKASGPFDLPFILFIHFFLHCSQTSRINLCAQKPEEVLLFQTCHGCFYFDVWDFLGPTGHGHFLLYFRHFVNVTEYLICMNDWTVLDFLDSNNSPQHIVILHLNITDGSWPGCWSDAATPAVEWGHGSGDDKTNWDWTWPVR